MPEGPEVKIISNYLNKVLKNLTIKSFHAISNPYLLKYNNLIQEINSFMPVKYKNSICIGKQTFIKIHEGVYFTYHLGMTGYWSIKKEKHSHLCITMSNNFKIYFHDTRRFGNIKIIKSNKLKDDYHLERDLLNGNYNENHFLYLKKTIKSNIEICKLLLNQKYFPGVGNYLKSEILYSCKIHPHTKWKQISDKNIIELCKKTNEIMTYCYNQGGAQLRDFKNPKKSSDLKLKIYGRSKDNEGNNITSLITKDNRRSFICEKRQVIRT